ncbi:MAG: GNAT family N-acetyltransferase, partial [Myxococcota bacterium]
VHPQHVGLGVGRALYDRAVVALSEIPFYWLVIWVVKGNRSARRFYEQCGLRTDNAHRIDRFAGQQVPVIRYAAPLNPAMNFDRLFE